MPRYGRRSGFTDPSLPKAATGSYYWCNSASGTSVNAGLGNGTLRLSLMFLPQATRIIRLGTEFTIAGEANSVVRIGIYNFDPAIDAPGTLALDAGSISTGTGNAGDLATGGTPGAYELTCDIWLPRGIYFSGGVVQGAPTTQPQLRTVRGTNLPISLAFRTTPLPSAGSTPFAFVSAGVNGALPSPISSPTGDGSGGPRLFYKVA